MKYHAQELIKEKIYKLTSDNPMLSGWSSYSQFDEDGIISNCLQRISTEVRLTKTCVEIGCGNGTQNNTHQLLLDGFSAFWIDESIQNIEYINDVLSGLVFTNLLVQHQLINKQNILSYAKNASNFLGCESVDFFSLDINGNDIHICREFIDILHPKLICVEYNAKFQPPLSLAIEYNEEHVWNNDDYFGASLQAWVDFFELNNYTLVCCNLTGVNAFFVQNQYLKNFTIYPIEKIFQPARYELIDCLNGHKSSLYWLKQILYGGATSNSKNQTTELKSAIAKTGYGHMAVYINDQIIGKSLLASGAFQETKIKEVLQFLDKYHNFKPSLFVDIGANIGTHLIYAIKNGLVKNAIAFEPDPDNLKLLFKNIAINNISSKVNVYPIALSSISGALDLELSNTNFGDHRVRPSSPAPVSFGEESERLTKEISALSLDSLDAEVEFSWSKALVWMDTQGHEGEIFAGGKQFLTSNRRPPVFIAEFWPYGIERSQSKQKYFDFLAQCKAIYDVNNPNWMSGQKITIDQLLTSYDYMLSLTEKEHHPHTDLMLIL